MDITLLKKNGKTICWKYLTPNDAEEVEELMVEYCKSEPLSAAINTEEMQLATLETAKVCYATLKNLNVFFLLHYCSFRKLIKITKVASLFFVSSFSFGHMSAFALIIPLHAEKLFLKNTRCEIALLNTEKNSTQN